MASAVDSRLAYARLSAVATASRLPTATRGSNNSYTTSWDTTLSRRILTWPMRPFRIASLDRLMFIYESLRGVQAGWQGDYHALAWLFEHVNTALAAAGDDYFLADLAVTSARTRTRMIDALSRLITDPISAEWGRRPRPVRAGGGSAMRPARSAGIA